MACCVQLEDAGGFRAVTSWNCSERVRGTDAFQFPPGLTRGGQLRVWIYEIFRSGLVTYRGDVDAHGVRLFRYTPVSDSCTAARQGAE